GYNRWFAIAYQIAVLTREVPMSRHTLPFMAVILSTAPAVGQVAPVADHHQHLFSPAMVALLDTTHALQPITARDVVALLDSAGIRQAILLSVAYIYGSPARSVPDEYAKVRAENDWNAAQAAEYPKRLRASCGFNPLKDYAIQELERCAGTPGLRGGHLAGSGPGYDDPAADSAMAVLAGAVERHDPRTRNLWFDVASTVTPDISPAIASVVVKRIRQVGVDRILYGSDAAAGGYLRPRESWAAFRRLPLTDKEFTTIARNLAPYLLVLP